MIEDQAVPEPIAAPETPEVAETEAPAQRYEPEAEPEGEPVTEGEAESEGEPTEEAPETVTVEIGGESYDIPKELEKHILMQGDYTRKTQEVAETRKTLDAEKEAFQQTQAAQAANLHGYAELSSIDQQLERYKSVDWDRETMNDPEQAQRAFQQYTLLRDRRGEVVSQIQQHEQQHATAKQTDDAKRLADARSYAEREIPNWSSDLESKLENFSKSHGIDANLIRQAAVTNPATLKILHLAYLGDEFLKKQRAATKPKSASVTPVKKVKSGSSPASGPRDDMSSDQWLAARNRQLAKKAG